jgi:hypothetical protein
MAAQTPAAITAQMIQLTSSTRDIETKLVTTFEKANYDRQLAAKQVAEAQQNVRKIRQLLDDIDNQYDKLSDAQRSSVRGAWDVVMILSTYVESQLQPEVVDIQIPGATEKSMLDEERTTALCAARRAAMLIEELERLKQS